MDTVTVEWQIGGMKRAFAQPMEKTMKVKKLMKE